MQIIGVALEGVGSARRSDELCREHVALPWCAGDESTNYPILDDFWADQIELLDDLLTLSVAESLAEELFDLKRVTQDVVRARVSAGAASFRRWTTLV